MSSPKDELLEKLQKMLSWKKSKAYYAKTLEINEDELESLMKELKKQEEPPVETWVDITEDTTSEHQVLVEEKITAEGENMEIKMSWTRKPSTPQEIEQAHEIDTDKWKLSSYWSKYNGKRWLVSAYFKRKDIDTDLQAQKQLVMEEMRNHSFSYEYEVEPAEVVDLRMEIESPKSNQNCLLEISIFDPHFGKLGWGEETGDDYDIEIATSRYQSAVAELVSRVNMATVSRIHIPLGNDLFNIDNEAGTTTAGTPQDSDSRFAKMVRKVKGLIVSTLDDLSKIAPVDVTIIPGNHDRQTTFMLGEIIEAWYHKNERVNVNNSAKTRKFYKYGENGFMYSHGDEEKHADLGILFATENPSLWAETKHRFVKVGHFHKSKKVDYITIDDKIGCQVQILPSLSGTDYYHYKKGYLSNKQAKAFLYHPRKGEVASYTYTV